MFWNRGNNKSQEEREVSNQCQAEAEQLYRSGKYHCAEAVCEPAGYRLADICRNFNAFQEIFQ